MGRVAYKETMRRAIRTYGEDAQKAVAIEEMAELQKEICKDLRGGGHPDHIAEEIADVEIMLEQLKIMYECQTDVQQWIYRKLQRLKERMDKEQAAREGMT